MSVLSGFRSYDYLIPLHGSKWKVCTNTLLFSIANIIEHSKYDIFIQNLLCHDPIVLRNVEIEIPPRQVASSQFTFSHVI